MKQRYGNTFGYTRIFESLSSFRAHVLGSPDLVTFDLDILRQALVKEPQNFADVIFFDFRKSPTEWKRMRNLIHPKFAAMKLQNVRHDF